VGVVAGDTHFLGDRLMNLPGGEKGVVAAVGRASPGGDLRRRVSGTGPGEDESGGEEEEGQKT
jgi:hypothetical protein